MHDRQEPYHLKVQMCVFCIPTRHLARTKGLFLKKFYHLHARAPNSIS